MANCRMTVLGSTTPIERKTFRAATAYISHEMHVVKDKISSIHQL